MNGASEDGAQESGRPRPPALAHRLPQRADRFGRDGRNSWPLRAGACAAAVRSLEADVVGLQEVRPLQEREDLRARLPATPGAGAGRDDGYGRGERFTVVYRAFRGLRLDGWTVNWFSDTPRTRKRSLGRSDPPHRHPVPVLGQADPRRGAFDVANAHWDGASAASAQRRAEALSAGSIPPSRGWSWATSTRRPLTQPSRAWSPVACATRSPTWASARAAGRDGPASGTGRPTARALDYVLADEHWDVLGARIDHTRPGGHLHPTTGRWSPRSRCEPFGAASSR